MDHSWHEISTCSQTQFKSVSHAPKWPEVETLDKCLGAFVRLPDHWLKSNHEVIKSYLDMTMVWSNFCKWIDLSTTWNLWPRYFENVCELDIMLASPATWVHMHWEVALTALSEAVPESEQCINSRHLVKHKSNTATFLQCTVSSTMAQHKSI